MAAKLNLDELQLIEAVAYGTVAQLPAAQPQSRHRLPKSYNGNLSPCSRHQRRTQQTEIITNMQVRTNKEACG